MLNTIEANQRELTESVTRLRGKLYENCIVVAVTAEKKVATVDRLSKLFTPCSWANRIVGTPGHRHLKKGKAEINGELTNFYEHRE
jgi:hypothetical protein